MIDTLEEIEEALRYFLEAEHLKEKFGDGLPVENLRHQGCALGQKTLASLKEYREWLDSEEFKTKLKEITELYALRLDFNI